MNICVVTNQVRETFSGIGLHANNLINGLIRDVHNVWVIVPEGQKPENDVPYTVICVPEPLFGGSQARWVSLSWNFARTVHDLMRRQPLDLVHFTDARESFFYRGNVPVVGNINDTYSAELHSLPYYRRYFSDWPIRWFYYRFVHLLEGIALRRLDAVIANSRYTASVVSREYRLKPEKLHTCYKSINPEIYQPVRARRQISPARPPRVLFVGTNMQRKGLPFLIKAAPSVIRLVPDVEFQIVGRDKVIPRMKNLCEQEGVLANFKFVGWQSQSALINQIYVDGDVFVMPSITEALGMVFVEAMASGIPVIGTRVGGIPEIIEDRINGRLVDYGDVQGLAGAIAEILLDPLVAERYRAAGLKTVDRFAVGEMMRCTYEIYRAVTCKAA